jgi:hypothetical protein
MMLWISFLLGVASIQTAPDTVTRKISSVAPSLGSLEGGTRIVIKGEGFSVNYANGGNKVMIGDAECKTVESSGFGACTVLCSNLNQIVCDTTAHAAAESTIKITVDGQYPVPVTRLGKFKYIASATGVLDAVHPSSGKAGAIINVRGTNFPSLLTRYVASLI